MGFPESMNVDCGKNALGNEWGNNCEAVNIKVGDQCKKVKRDKQANRGFP